MAINVSANTLFNFMKKFEYLKMILDKKFHPRFYKEDLRPFFKLPVFIAMKCFCDIPLSLVTEHTNTYGKYAIGLSKEWGKAQGLSPITYYNESSPFIEAIIEGYNANVKLMNSTSSDEIERSSILGKAKSSYQQTFLNYKPINGRMWRDNDWKRDINFYNEREWRYIPPRFVIQENNDISEGEISCKNYYTTKDLYILSSQIDKYKHSIKRKRKLEIESQELEKLNKFIAKEISIHFDYSDINFIIVQSDEEVIELCEYIDKLKENNNNANILKTKIIKYSDIDLNV